MEKYDVTIIGSGPGGYVCAIRCAQLGLKTALIEKYPTLGGTCLNVGCIPSKALLESSERYFDANNHFKDHGIDVGKVKLDFTQMVGRVKKVVADTCEGVKYLMGKNKVTVLQGHGSFVDDHTLNIHHEGKDTQIQSDKIVIATGSKPSSLPGIEVDKERIITSTEGLYLDEVPKSLIVIGGGVIGLELGSVYARLGAEVHVVEFADSIIATMDKDLGKELTKTLKKEGMKIHTGTAVQKVVRSGKKVKVTAKNKKGEEVVFDGDYCLVAVGRRPYTDKLDLDKAGLAVDDRGRVDVNDHLQTTKPHIFGIGDVVKGAMLAHKAEEEGVFVAESIAGQKPHINYNLIPGVVYTWPEVAAVGATEQQLKDQKVPYKTGKFPFKASGRARAGNESDGFVKVLAHKDTDEILGVHMIGPRCADMIAEAVIAMEYRASAEDVARSCHAHPTYTECLKEACLAATDNRAIHS
jgi:dihydrolipoamide dehydrogenase